MSLVDYIWCPFCDEDFTTIDDWYGKCPSCGEKWMMEKFYTEDYSDSWFEPMWESRT